MAEEDLFRREVLSVSDLTGRLQDVVESEFGVVWLVGEISTLRQPSSGHFYFILKDSNAQIRAVMFRTRQRYLGFEPGDGQEVLCRGKLSVYAARGEYQIVVDYMEPRGEGALRLAFEKLKTKLAEEGLFDHSRKKKLPFLPRRVALVTSPTGAAVRDFIRVARRRFENVTLSVYPVRVQGAMAASEIAQAVRDINDWGGFDVIVLTRGGGSLEDLWAFNEEVVARAVAASTIPVVSAVGHEIDFTIADLAADLRAPTPSAAAELIFREKAELRGYLESSIRRMRSVILGRTGLFREQLAHLNTRLGDPRRILAEQRLRLDDLAEAMASLMEKGLRERRNALKDCQARLMPENPRYGLAVQRARLASLSRSLGRAGLKLNTGRRSRLTALAGRLHDLSPLAVLDRGYALVRKRPEMKTLKSSLDVSSGDRLNILLSKGEIEASVQKVTK